MASDELALLWKQVDTLQQALSDLIELQRAALHAQRSQTVDAPGAHDLSAAIDPVLGQLDALRDRLRPDQEQAADRAARRSAGERPCFEELDVERINVMEPDGTLRLAIHSAAREPDVVTDGKPLQRSGGRSAGMKFYNDEGDECGGLSFGGRRRDGGYAAGAGLLFDQFKQDQIVGIMHGDANGQRWGGFWVWDRPAIPLSEWHERWEAIRQMPEGPERDAAIKEMRVYQPEEVQRVFVGKTEDRAAVVRLCDTRRRVRLLLAVDAAGTPSLEFLDEVGQVSYRLPPSVQQEEQASRAARLRSLRGQL